MNTPKWVRNPAIIKKAIKEVEDMWIAGETVKIYFPVFYEEKGLASIESTVNCAGILMVAVDGNYGVLSVNTRIVFTASEINKVTMDDQSYYELVFDKGSTICPNINCVKNDGITYQLYDCFISKGNIPWYMSYNDMCHLFDTADEYAGAGVGKRAEVIQLMVSLIARDKKDRTKFYRQTLTENNSLDDNLVFIPIRNVEYGASNTINKLGGSYFSTGVVSALLNPADKVENIEEILRD